MATALVVDPRPSPSGPAGCGSAGHRYTLTGTQNSAPTLGAPGIARFTFRSAMSYRAVCSTNGRSQLNTVYPTAPRYGPLTESEAPEFGATSGGRDWYVSWRAWKAMPI